MNSRGPTSEVDVGPQGRRKYTMRLSKFVSAAMIVGALGFGAIGPGGAVASADPVAPAPLKPHDDFCPPWCGDGNGRGHGNGRGNDNGGGQGWDKGPWWANNR